MATVNEKEPADLWRKKIFYPFKNQFKKLVEAAMHAVIPLFS